MNGLVSRKVCDTKPVTVQYALTPYSDTLTELLQSMEKWGIQHRNKSSREPKWIRRGTPYPDYNGAGKPGM